MKPSRAPDPPPRSSEARSRIGPGLLAALTIGATLALVAVLAATSAGRSAAQAMPAVSVAIWPEPEGFDPSPVTVTVGTQFFWSNERSTSVTLAIRPALAGGASPTSTPEPPAAGTPVRVFLPVVADGAGPAAAGSGAQHPSVRADDTSPFGPQTLAPGARFAFTFQQPGSFVVYLADDPAATSSVTVEAVTPTPVGTAPSYQVIDLGTPFGASSQGLGINDGQQVGFSVNSSTNSYVAVLWSHGAPTNLNPASPLGTRTTSGKAIAINQNGTVLATFVGACSSGSCGGAYLYQNGTVTPIPSSQMNAVYGLNDLDQVVGTSGGPSPRAAVWLNGTVTPLVATAGESWANAINDAGQAVGPGIYAHGYLWQNGTATDLGTFGGCSNTPWAINNEGQIVGEAQTGGEMKPCDGYSDPYLWQNGSMIDLGLAAGCNGAAYAINDHGAVVGLCGGAFLWQNGRLEHLSALIPAGSGWTELVPSGIDDAGDIIASATYQGQTAEHAVLLVPS